MKPEPTDVLIVLNGRDLPRETMLGWARLAKTVYAADGAAEWMLPDVVPTMVVGDGDSLDRARHAHIPYTLAADQDSSDCDKVLAYAAAQGHQQVVVVGLEGDRLDHVMGSLQSLAACPLSVRVVLRKGAGHVLKPGWYEFSHVGPFSVMPLRDGTLTLARCEWPLNAAPMLSLSNQANGVFEVEVHSGVAFLVLVDHGPESGD